MHKDYLIIASRSSNAVPYVDEASLVSSGCHPAPMLLHTLCCWEATLYRIRSTSDTVLQDAKWIMFDGMSDVTFRRQFAAVNGLGTLLSRRHEAQDQARSSDEVNMMAMWGGAVGAAGAYFLLILIGGDLPDLLLTDT